jgi:hypothetical protein
MASEENHPSAAKAGAGLVERDVRAKARTLQSLSFSAATKVVPLSKQTYGPGFFRSR